MSKTASVASAKGTGVPAHLVPPAKWVCPSCGSTIQTLVPTRVPICNGKAHSRRHVHMEVAK
jgi:rubrerythrin